MRHLPVRPQEKLIQQLKKLLGHKCECCGRKYGLEIDHRIPRKDRKNFPRSLQNLKDACKNHRLYQRLCWDCNRWKNNGPACPCKWWDKTYPGWRKHIVYKPKGTSRKRALKIGYRLPKYKSHQYQAQAVGIRDKRIKELAKLGLNGNEIGKMFKLTRERIRQILIGRNK